MIICAFSGCGKSTLSKKPGMKIVDLDSYGFSNHRNFPHNYFKTLELYLTSDAYSGYHILMSTHPVVLQGLIERNIPHVVVAPDQDVTFNEWEKRWHRPGDSTAFYDKMKANFQNFTQDVREHLHDHDTLVKLVKLNKDQYLSDVIDEVLAAFDK